MQQGKVMWRLQITKENNSSALMYPLLCYVAKCVGLGFKGSEAAVLEGLHFMSAWGQTMEGLAVIEVSIVKERSTPTVQEDLKIQ